MKSLYAQYVEEREGFKTLENEKGFATYKISGDECYIRDIFVKKEFRKEKVASEMADRIAEIAKDSGCKYLTGTVVSYANGATASLKVLLGYGFQLIRSEIDKMVFIKEIV